MMPLLTRPLLLRLFALFALTGTIAATLPIPQRNADGSEPTPALQRQLVQEFLLKQRS